MLHDVTLQSSVVGESSRHAIEYERSRVRPKTSVRPTVASKALDWRPLGGSLIRSANDGEFAHASSPYRLGDDRCAAGVDPHGSSGGTSRTISTPHDFGLLESTRSIARSP